VEYKLKRVISSRVLDPRRAFGPALEAYGIADDCYENRIEMIVRSLRIHMSARENIGCTWKCHQTNTGITNKHGAISGYLWIIVERSAAIGGAFRDAKEKCISLKGEYDAWDILHYPFSIVPPIIFFHTVFVVLLQYRTNEKVSD
jgi:hypothetical protein